MIAALWANEGFNDDKGSRQTAIEEIEQHYQVALNNIHGPSEQEEKIDPDNPFFSSTQRQMKALDEKLAGGTVAEAAEKEDFNQYIDQG